MKKKTTTFNRSINKGKLSKATVFSEGKSTAEFWKEWMAHPQNMQELEGLYQKDGLKGVMELAGVKKTQAYEIIAAAGLIRKKSTMRNKVAMMNHARTCRNDRLNHLWDHYRWTPGMNICRLNGTFHRYPYETKAGNAVMRAHRCYYVATMPSERVSAFMKKRGLKYWLTPMDVIPCDSVQDSTCTLVIRVSHRFLKEKEALAPDCMEMTG